ncbi:MAG TPA: glycosyltransferase 87 family protein [Solirubrobacteraceae bacterium]
MPRIAVLRDRLPFARVRIALGPVAGRMALASLLLSAVALVLFSTSGPSILVPRSNEVFPGWEAGPLHLLSAGLPRSVYTLDYGLSVILVVMTLGYFVAIASARTLSMRLIVGCIVALHVILLMGPSMQLTDLFNYLGYARLGGLHGLNPYTHVIAKELYDPAYRFSTWHRLQSPYGPLFTALTYLLPLGSLSLSYWLIKTFTVLASLGFLAIVWHCAKVLGRDPRFVLVFVAFNPIYLVYAIGGFHNDFFMLIPSMAAIAFLLARRDRSAGAVLMLAVGVKFTAILLLPFLLVAVRPSRERMRRILEGAVLGAIPLIALSLALFGLSLPNLQDQSTLLTDYSIPNTIGLIIGGGGTPTLLRILDVAAVAAVLWLLWRPGDWISRAGWATLALLVTLAWLMPWYVIWVAPLAALGSSVRLRRATIVFTLFLVITFLPAFSIYLQKQGINPLATPAGAASSKLMHKLT